MYDCRGFAAGWVCPEQLYGPASLPPLPSVTDIIKFYSMTMARYSLDPASEKLLAALYMPGLLPSYWPSLSAKQSVQEFCKGKTLIALTVLAEVLEADMSGCPPFGIRYVLGLLLQTF